MNEYLNKQDVLSAINNVMIDKKILHKFRALRLRINRLSTTDIEEDTCGKWIYNTNDFTPKLCCTACGYNKPIISGENTKQIPNNYCPNCGAKMDNE